MFSWGIHCQTYFMIEKLLTPNVKIQMTLNQNELRFHANYNQLCQVQIFLLFRKVTEIWESLRIPNKSMKNSPNINWRKRNPQWTWKISPYHLIIVFKILERISWRRMLKKCQLTSVNIFPVSLMETFNLIFDRKLFLWRIKAPSQRSFTPKIFKGIFAQVYFTLRHLYSELWTNSWWRLFVLFFGVICMWNINVAFCFSLILFGQCSQFRNNFYSIIMSWEYDHIHSPISVNWNNGWITVLDSM